MLTSDFFLASSPHKRDQRFARWACASFFDAFGRWPGMPARYTAMAYISPGPAALFISGANEMIIDSTA